MPKLEQLSQQSIYFGTSSWKYTGWKGMVYLSNYSSEKAFKERSLEEYSTHYPVVGVDHTYYAFPTPKQMEKYFEQTPQNFKFVLKATENTTVFRFPNISRYGKHAGKTNPDFLRAQLFLENFLEPVSALGDKLGAIIFEFSKFRTGTFAKGSDFVTALDRFLEELRKNTQVPLAIELRNRNWLAPEYFQVLNKHQIAHVFNSWTEMPLLVEQMERTRSFDFPFVLARLLLKPGIPYQTAVDTYSPYDHLHEELTEIRASTAKLVQKALKAHKKAYILVNNRFEGCAPKTIEGIVSLL